jgi:hypothetical protein
VNRSSGGDGGGNTVFASAYNELFFLDLYFVPNCAFYQTFLARNVLCCALHPNFHATQFYFLSEITKTKFQDKSQARTTDCHF